MREFIRLQLKLKWGFNRNNSKVGAIMTAVAALIAVLIALALVWLLTFVLRQSLSVSAKRLAVLYLTVIMLGMTVAATDMQLKRLYRPTDLFITARFPLSPFKLFVSYLLLNYIDLCIYSAILLLPVMTVFGMAMHCLSLTYFLGVLLGVVFMPVLPFGLSIFIAIPTVYVTSLLERHGIVRLAVFVLFLVGAFVLYDYILTVLAQFFIRKNWEEGTLEIWASLLASLDSYYNPAYYLGDIMFFESFWLGLGVLVGSGAAVVAGGVALARVVCRGLRDKALDSGNGRYTRRSQVDDYGTARAILRYSLREILRTKTYSYFYLGVAISTPVMVFFCNRLVTLVGEAQIGRDINFGVSMLVTAVFMAMISSFASTLLSVEGKSFYITKLVPFSYRRQLLIKGALNICVSAVALLISAAVMGSLQFVNAAEMAVLVFSQLLLAAGLVFNGINLNLVNPSLKLKANGEAEEINIAYMLIIGFAIAAVLGACSIILPKILPNGRDWAYALALVMTFVYAAASFAVFWFTAEKKYRQIEV